jgi:hypothetical protein
MEFLCGHLEAVKNLNVTTPQCMKLNYFTRNVRIICRRLHNNIVVLMVMFDDVINFSHGRT